MLKASDNLSAGALTAVGELSTEQRTVLKEHGLAWVLFLTPEAQVRISDDDVT